MHLEANVAVSDYTLPQCVVAVIVAATDAAAAFVAGAVQMLHPVVHHVACRPLSSVVKAVFQGVTGSNPEMVT